MTQQILFNNLRRQTHVIRDALDAAYERVTSGGWYVLGSENQNFEQEFAAFCGSKYAVGVANGSDALELALRAVGVAFGERVATVANAGGYATTAIRLIGAQPAFIDVKAETQLVDLAHLKTLICSQPISAVVITHLFGRMVDMARVESICWPWGIPVIEDCAQAHGAKLHGRMAGSVGAIGCFSFYPTKNLGALGDGGAIITSDETIAERIRSLRQYGWKGKYHVVLSGGRNSRLDELQAAFLRTKLPYLECWNERRRAIADRYRNSIKNERVECPPSGGADYVAHLFAVRCTNRDGLRAYLQASQIESDVHYPIPDHLQTAWVVPSVSPPSLPTTERLASELISLPCYPELSNDEVDSVIQAVNRW